MWTARSVRPLPSAAAKSKVETGHKARVAPGLGTAAPGRGSERMSLGVMVWPSLRLLEGAMVAGEAGEGRGG